MTPHRICEDFLAPAIGCVLIAGGIVLAAANSAPAHQAPSGWIYPWECCSGRDCTIIPASQVRATARGYEARLEPGQHNFLTPATGGRDYVIPYGQAKPSPDGDFHICIRPAYAQTPFGLICFFAPPPGV
jgi:hypothetical protein